MKPATFSPSTQEGCSSRITRSISGHRNRASSFPRCFPATENGWQGTVLCTELPGAEDAAAALKRCWQAAKPDAALPADSRLELVCWDPAQNRKVQLPEE